MTACCVDFEATDTALRAWGDLERAAAELNGYWFDIRVNRVVFCRGQQVDAPCQARKRREA